MIYPKFKNKLLLFSIFILLIITITFESGCTKIVTSDLGSEVLSEIDGVNTFDTFLNVITETVFYTDSSRIYAFNISDSNYLEYSSDMHILGNVSDDPEFGKVKAWINFKVSAPYYPFYFLGNRDSIIVDSAVLVFDLRSYYGDLSQPMKINVYNLERRENSLSTTTHYASNYPEKYSILPTNIVSTKADFVAAHFLDSFNFRSEHTTNQIRIPLSKELANLFIKAYDSNVEYKSDSALLQIHPGFLIECVSGNALLNIGVANTNISGINFYYSTKYTSEGTDSTSKRDTTYSHFNISYITANFIKRDYANAEILNHINKKNDSVVYLQTNPGTVVKVKIPGLKNFPNKIIHLAQLTTTQVANPLTFNTYNQFFPPPSYVLINTLDSATGFRRTIPNDFFLSNTLNYSLDIYNSGFARYDSVSNQYNNLVNYNFNLTRYIQGIVSRQDSVFDFELTAPGNDILNYQLPHNYNSNVFTKVYFKPRNGQPVSSLNALNRTNAHANGRVVLAGGSKTVNPMRLRIVYSNIKN